MKTYLVKNSAVLIRSGNLALKEGQARPRQHRLQNTKPGVFRVVDPVQFKVGESIGYDGDMGRLLENNLELVESEKPIKTKK